MSILHLLVAIVAVPVLTLPVFAWAYAQDRQTRSGEAGRIATALQSVAALDTLRYALWSESTALLVPIVTRVVVLTPAQRATIPAGMLSGSPESMRAAIRRTDDAVAVARRDGLRQVPGGAASVTQLTRSLAPLRATSLRLVPRASSVADALPMLQIGQKYSALSAQVNALEAAGLRRISDGDFGSGSAALLRADGQTAAIGDLTLLVQQQQVLYFSLRFGLMQDPRQLDTLRDVTGAVNVLSGRLSSLLSPGLRQAWDTIQRHPQVLQYHGRMKASVLSSAGPDANGILASLGDVPPEIADATFFGEQLNRLTTAAVRDGVQLAGADRDLAASRARIALLGALLSVGTAVLVLALVGGLIRRRLGDLAGAAERLSAGTFELMPVRGPREVALASSGLNDAVHGLREITAKARLIAAGDTSAPALAQPSPGPLGAALHASFEHVVAMIRERETLQQQLAHDATHDSLTGLFNRAAAEGRLREALQDAARRDTAVAVLFIDLDHFKAVNDAFGHSAGDEVLRVTARRLSALVRLQDDACRLGGDEFVVVMADADPAAAAAAAARIVDAVGGPIPWQGHDLHVGASIGIALWPDPDGRSTAEDCDGQAGRIADDPGVTADELLNRADRAVYRAKADGRNLARF